MIGVVIHGNKYVGWPVSNGIREEIYCEKCKQVRPFIEMEGRKFFHTFYVPLIPTGGKKRWLECMFCDSVLLNNEVKNKTYTHKENEVMSEEIRKEIFSILEEMEYIDVKCPACKKDGKVRLPEQQVSAEAICHICGNIYEVRKQV